MTPLTTFKGLPIGTKLVLTPEGRANHSGDWLKADYLVVALPRTGLTRGNWIAYVKNGHTSLSYMLTNTNCVALKNQVKTCK